MGVLSFVLAAGLFAYGSFWIRISVIVLLERRTLLRKGVKADAHCVDRTWSSQGTPYYTLRFETESGRTFRTKVSDSYLPADFTEDSVATVVYDPNRPGKVETSHWLQIPLWKNLGQFLPFIAGIALCGVAVWIAVN